MSALFESPQAGCSSARSSKLSWLTDYDVGRSPVSVDDFEVRLPSQAALEADLKCSLCKRLLNRAQTSTICCHSYCERCVFDCFARGSKCCPECKAKLTTRRSLRRDAEIDSVIDALFPRRSVEPPPPDDSQPTADAICQEPIRRRSPTKSMASPRKRQFSGGPSDEKQKNVGNDGKADSETACGAIVASSPNERLEQLATLPIPTVWDNVDLIIGESDFDALGARENLLPIVLRLHPELKTQLAQADLLSPFLLSDHAISIDQTARVADLCRYLYFRKSWCSFGKFVKQLSLAESDGLIVQFERLCRIYKDPTQEALSPSATLSQYRPQTLDAAATPTKRRRRRTGSPRKLDAAAAALILFYRPPLSLNRLRESREDRSSSSSDDSSETTTADDSSLVSSSTA